MSGHPEPPYGTAIQQAIAKGDLAQMKQLAKDSDDFLAKYGDVRAAAEVLKVEIARLEAAQARK